MRKIFLMMSVSLVGFYEKADRDIGCTAAPAGKGTLSGTRSFIILISDALGALGCALA